MYVVYIGGHRGCGGKSPEGYFTLNYYSPPQKKNSTKYPPIVVYYIHMHFSSYKGFLLQVLVLSDFCCSNGCGIKIIK
jgi:hypothetical protein